MPPCVPPGQVRDGSTTAMTQCHFCHWNRAIRAVMFGMAAMLAPIAAGVSDIYVSPDGNDANSGLEPFPIQTLGEAVARANAQIDATTLHFAPGTYSADINMFLSYPTTITGPGAVLHAAFICDNTVEFHDVSILAKGTSYSVLVFYGGTLENVNFIGDPLTAPLGTIGLSFASDLPCTAIGNTFTDYGAGIEARRGPNDPLPDIVLRENYFIRCLAGVLCTSTIVDGGTTSDHGLNVFEECDIAISNVAGLGQFFDGNQFLIRDPATNVVYGLTNYELIRDKQLAGFVNLISVQDPIPSELGGAGPQDINQDGFVDAVDVQLVINGALIGGVPLADVNQDGAVDAVDVQLVINRALE